MGTAPPVVMASVIAVTPMHEDVQADADQKRQEKGKGTQYMSSMLECQQSPSD